jgi:predicted acyltransferase
MMEVNATPADHSRLASVDAFRGMTMIAMILVNNPGDWGAVYRPLAHAEWHGWTLADLVFPFFLFIVGVSVVLALKRRVEEGVPRAPLVAKILKRSLILFALGLFLNGYPFGLFGPQSIFEFLDTWRIPGVLQRIAICYLVVSLLVLYCRVRMLKVLTVVLLIGYWAVITMVPAPGRDAPNIDTKGDHLAGWVDRAVFGDHLWQHAEVYDPEGLLSTTPALSTTLFGVFAGLLLVSRRGPADKLGRLFSWGVVLVVCGMMWNRFFPINKPLWTSSYALFTAGMAFLVLALCHWLFDIRGYQRVARVFAIYGMNAIAVFVGSGILSRTLAVIRIGGTSLKQSIYQSLFASWLPPHSASFSYAIAWVVGWWLVLAWMHRRGIFIKI